MADCEHTDFTPCKGYGVSKAWQADDFDGRAIHILILWMMGRVISKQSTAAFPKRTGIMIP